jgi:PDZ domain-containing protein
VATWQLYALVPPMNTMGPTVPGPPGPDGVRGKLTTGGWSSLLAVLVLAAAAVGFPTAIASHEASTYFVFSPGSAPVITTSAKCQPARGELELPGGAPCVRLVVPKAKAHDVDGELLMVDVEVSQASPLDYVEDELGLLGNQRQLVKISQYAGSTPTSELGCQDTQEMTSADQDAAIAALETLHYHVSEDPLGAQIDVVDANSPAWDAGLGCNDLVTAVDGRTVRDAQDFATLMKPLRPGTVVELTDHPAGGGRARRISVRLGRPPTKFPADAYLGVAFSTRDKSVLPFRVALNAGDIGGPSAGLAFTLAILDTLSNGKLTGGHRVAATGQIDTYGNVLDVGGVQEKTAAVQEAGAQVFFVPKGEYADAMSVAGKNLRVIPVTTLHQALEALQDDYGGDLSGLAGDR